MPAARLLADLRRHADPRAAWGRLLDSLPAILQISLAAVLAYAFAQYVLGHQTPFLAATVSLTALGFSRDARPRRVVETSFGMVTGILLAELSILLLGQGVWQLGAVLLLTLVIARLVSPSTSFAVVAAVQSMLVVVLADPGGGSMMRAIDGLVGGVVALLVTALLPRDPKRLAVRDGRALIGEFDAALLGLADALRRADHERAAETLELLRRTQPLVDAWATSLDSAQALARLSPLLWRQRGPLQEIERVHAGFDLAIRNLRVVARRVAHLVEDGRPRPVMSGILTELAEAVQRLVLALDEPQRLLLARQALMLVALRLDPAEVDRSADLDNAGLVLQLRPLLVDLMVTAGASQEQARASLPVLPRNRWIGLE